MKTTDISASEFDPYYGRYIYKVSDEVTLRKGFEEGISTVVEFFRTIPADKLDHRYEPDKWSIKEIIQHLIDTERIFIYRCFRIARRDKTSLAGFDQTTYMKPSSADHKKLDDLLSEFAAGRANSIAILNSLSDDDLKAIGESNSTSMSARAAAFTIIGHDIWHMEIIKKRYL